MIHTLSYNGIRHLIIWTAIALAVSIAIAGETPSSSAPRGPATHPTPINPEDVPLATSADIWVGVTTIPPLPPDAPKKMPPSPPMACGVFAYVVNRSDHPIRLYMPGLVGPNFLGTKGSNVDGVELPMYRPSRFKSGDFVVLPPGELYGRRSSRDSMGEEMLIATTYYLIYPPDRMGRWSEALEIVYPGGSVHKVKR